MIRTEKNFLSGPFPAEEVREMIKSGKLSYQDEVAPANGYWFYLHEVDEVKKHLGIDVPRANDQPIEDATLTEFDVAEELPRQSAMAGRGRAGRTSSTGSAAAWSKTASHPNNPHADPDLPGVDDMPDTLSESTAMIAQSGASSGSSDLLPGAEQAEPVQSSAPGLVEGLSKEAEEQMRQTAALLAKENARRLQMLLLVAVIGGVLLALFIALFR